MKKFSMFKMVFCVFSLLIILGIPNVFGQQTKTYGYVIFRDAGNDAIKSDGEGQYTDCRRIGGEDTIEIETKASSGSLVKVEFYPGKMYQINNTPSTRRIKFCFNVSGLTTFPGPSSLGRLAVRDILLKYKDTTEDYIDRSTTNRTYATLSKIRCDKALSSLI